MKEEDLIKKIQEAVKEENTNEESSVFNGFEKRESSDIVTPGSQDGSKEEDETERKLDNELIETATVESEMKRLNISKDDIFDMIASIADNGFYEEKVELFGGRVSAVFRSTNVGEQKRFVELMNSLGGATRMRVDFGYNHLTMSTILREYNGENTGDTTEERAKFVESIPTPVYQAVLDKLFLFSAKVNLLSTEEVLDFF